MPAARLDFRGVDVERCCGTGLGESSAQPRRRRDVGRRRRDADDLELERHQRFDVTGGWTSGAPLSRGTIFTDRQMYQPGERGEITGIAYYVNGERVVADAKAELHRQAESIRTTSRPSSERSQTDALRRVLDADSVFQATGAWATTRSTPKAPTATTSAVRCASPSSSRRTSSLTLTLGRDVGDGRIEHPGASRRPTISSVRRCRAARRTRTLPATLRPCSPRDGTTIGSGRQWFWPEQTPTFDSDVLQRDLALDAQGKDLARRRRSERPAVSDDVPRRHGDQRRLASLGLRLAELSWRCRRTR